MRMVIFQLALALIAGANLAWFAARNADQLLGVLLGFCFAGNLALTWLACFWERRARQVAQRYTNTSLMSEAVCAQLRREGLARAAAAESPDLSPDRPFRQPASTLQRNNRPGLATVSLLVAALSCCSWLASARAARLRRATVRASSSSSPAGLDVRRMAEGARANNHGARGA